MTPEQAAEWVRAWVVADPGGGSAALSAAKALLAGFDSQAAELADLRFFASVFAQDNADLMEAGAMREREECCRALCEWCDGGESVVWDDRKRAWYHHASWDRCLASDVRSGGSRGPRLPPEVLAAANKRLREVLAKVVALASDAFQGLGAWRDALAEARKLLGEAGR